MTSLHYDRQRYYREMFIENYLGGDGEVVDRFIVNRGHKDGTEIHTITDHGVIIIHNLYSGKLVTKLVARPQQVKRYYEHTKRHPAESLLAVCREHQEHGFNNF